MAGIDYDLYINDRYEIVKSGRSLNISNTLLGMTMHVEEFTLRTETGVLETNKLRANTSIKSAVNSAGLSDKWID